MWQLYICRHFSKCFQSSSLNSYNRKMKWLVAYSLVSRWENWTIQKWNLLKASYSGQNGDIKPRLQSFLITMRPSLITSPSSSFCWATSPYRVQLKFPIFTINSPVLQPGLNCSAFHTFSRIVAIIVIFIFLLNINNSFLEIKRELVLHISSTWNFVSTNGN